MKLYWLDLETTGLDPNAGRILEVAVSEADILTPFEARPIYHAVATFQDSLSSHLLSPFVRDMHTKNGLLDECRRSTKTLAEIQEELMALVPASTDREDMPTLAGSCIHFDHAWMQVWWKELANRFHYRHYDVSAVKLFARSLGMPKLPRAEAHRAADDVLESIAHAKACAEWLTHVAEPCDVFCKPQAPGPYSDTGK